MGDEPAPDSPSDPSGTGPNKGSAGPPRVDDTGVWESIQARADGGRSRSSGTRTKGLGVAFSRTAITLMMAAVAAASLFLAGCDVRDSPAPARSTVDGRADPSVSGRGTPIAAPIPQIPEGADPDVPGPASQERPGPGDFDAAMDCQSGCVVVLSARAGTWTFDVITNRWRKMRPVEEPDFVKWGWGARRLVYDAAADLTIAIARVTFWAYSVERNSWTRLPHTYPGPDPLGLTDLAVYDPISGRIVLMTEDANLWAYDVQTFTWTELEQAGEVPALSVVKHSVPSGMKSDLDRSLLSYDAATDRLVLTVLGTGTWTYDLGSGVWASTESPLPVALRILRRDFPDGQTNVAYDAAHERTVVFTGTEFAVFDAGPGDWSVIQAGPGWPDAATTALGVGPWPFGSHSLVYDPVNERVVALGVESLVPVLGDVWAYDLGSDTWIQLLAPSEDSRRATLSSSPRMWFKPLPHHRLPRAPTPEQR